MRVRKGEVKAGFCALRSGDTASDGRPAGVRKDVRISNQPGGEVPMTRPRPHEIIA
jgi:hypothetical protein